MSIPIRIKRGQGAPASLLRGELAYDEVNRSLFVGEGTSGNDAEGRPIAATIRELTTPASFLAQLADVSVATVNGGDVLTYDDVSGDWIAQAVAASSVAWADVTGKPSTFTPDTHTHAWGDIASGVPSTFAPSTHASSHATGGADAIAPADIGAAAASHTHGSITNDGKIGSTAGLPVVTGSAGAVTTLALGTAGQVLRVNAAADGVEFGTTAGESVGWADVTDKPTTFAPSAHKSSHATGGADALAPADIGAAPASHTHSASDIISGLATVATTGAYSDLSGTPTLGTAAASATTDFVAASAASTFGLSLLDDADAAAARDTLSLGSAATLESTAFADADHSHDWTDITTGVPSTFTPSAHNHTIKQELSGFIESPESKTYVLSPATHAAMTITQLKAQTSAGTVDVKIQDDGADVTGATLADAGTTLASLASDISVSVAAGSKLTLVVSDPQSSPADLAFTVHYTIASENNA